MCVLFMPSDISFFSSKSLVSIQIEIHDVSANLDAEE